MGVKWDSDKVKQWFESRGSELLSEYKNNTPEQFMIFVENYYAY